MGRRDAHESFIFSKVFDLTPTSYLRWQGRRAAASAKDFERKRSKWGFHQQRNRVSKSKCVPKPEFGNEELNRKKWRRSEPCDPLLLVR